MKGILKNKKARYIIGASTFLGLIFTGFGLCIDGLVKGGAIKKDIEAQYKETEFYKEYISEQEASIQERLDNNEITEKQAEKERKNLSSWNTVEDVILKENTDNAQYKDMLNEYKKYDTIRFSGLLVANVCNLFLCSWNMARLIKSSRDRKRKMKESEEDWKLERERLLGKELDDYKEELED